VYDNFYFRLADVLGEILLTSVTYRTHSDCIYAITTMRTVILDDSCFKFSDLPGKYFFTLYTDENITIAVSKFYRTPAGSRGGAELLKKLVSIAEVDDKSLFIKYIRV
jgi:uncharacterized protein YegP (UPF0339 family)